MIIVNVLLYIYKSACAVLQNRMHSGLVLKMTEAALTTLEKGTS